MMGRQGSVLVEFALVGTMFFSLFLLALLLGFWVFTYSTLEGAVRDVGRACAAQLGTGTRTDTLCQSSDGVRTLLEPRLPGFFIMDDIKISSYQFDSVEAASSHVPTQAMMESLGAEVFSQGGRSLITYEIFYEYPISTAVPFMGELVDVRAYTVLLREP